MRYKINFTIQDALNEYYGARDDSIHFDLQSNNIQECLKDFRYYAGFNIFNGYCKCTKRE